MDDKPLLENGTIYRRVRFTYDRGNDCPIFVEFVERARETVPFRSSGPRWRSAVSRIVAESSLPSGVVA